MAHVLRCGLEGPQELARKIRLQVAGLPGAPASPELPGPGKLDARARVTAIREALRKLQESIRAAATVIDISGHLSDRDDQLLRARELLMAMARRLHKPGTPDEWDEETYLLLHPDVAYAVQGGGFESGYDHWVRVGQKEGRIIRYNRNRLDLPPDFDEAGYLALNPDAAEEVAAGMYASGYEHWKQKGARQRRPMPRPGAACAPPLHTG